MRQCLLCRFPLLIGEGFSRQCNLLETAPIDGVNTPT